MFQQYFNFNKYYYNIPLCYQTIEETENSKNWPILAMLVTLKKKTLSILII